MINDLLIPFLAVGLAELGDKTQLAILCLASKTKKHLQLLAGIIIAFIATDGIAVAAGSFLTEVAPLIYIRIISAIIFIVFGVIILINHKKEEEKCELKAPFASGLAVIMASEMGDKTQIAAGLFAAEFNPLLVFLGVILALALLSAIAVYLGKQLTENINKKFISIIAGSLFIVIGISTLIISYAA